MKSLGREESLEQWQVYWNEAKLEFFKVEAMQDYGAEDIAQSPSYNAWLGGDKKKSIELIKLNAHKWANQTREKHIRKIRVRIVVEPYSSYLQWEIKHYKLSNIPIGGEEVYILNLKDIPELKIPGDFMIFDNARVANSHYSNEGKMLGMDFYDNGENITEFLKLKNEFMKHGKILSNSSR